MPNLIALHGIDESQFYHRYIPDCLSQMTSGENNTVNQSQGERYFLRIVDWDWYQYSGSHKKPNPPWLWARLPRVLIDNPQFQKMTMAQRGAFCWLLLLASETGNLIEDDPRVLRIRIQVDPRLIRSLIKLGLIERIAIPAESPEIKELRKIYSGGGPEQLRTLEGEGRTAPDLTSRGSAKAGSNRDPDSCLPKFKQPEFEVLVSAVMDAGVRGSDWEQIGKIIEEKFGFTPSQHQFIVLDRQIRDRRKE